MGAKFTDEEVVAALRAALPAESDAIYHEGMGVLVRDQMEELIKTFSGDDDTVAPDDLLVRTTTNIASKVAGPALKDLGDEEEFYTLYLVGGNLPVVLRFIQIYADEFIQQLRGGEAIPAAAVSGLASWLTINFNVNSSLAIAAGTLIILTLGRSIGKSLERHQLERGLSTLASRNPVFSEGQVREALARPLPPLPRHVRIFYSYAHCDEKYRLVLQHALAMLR
jgi:hypothetical protein